MLDVCLLGTAGMMPLPHRWLTAALMRYNGSNLLIDCGEGTQIAIKEKGWTFKPIAFIAFPTSTSVTAFWKEAATSACTTSIPFILHPLI